MNRPRESRHTFLSYSHADAEIALRFAVDLRNAGIALWVDRLDGILVGATWRRTIEEAIDSCSSMLALISPNYVKAKYCLRELARADALERAILPVLLTDVNREEWPLVIEGVQYADFRSWRDERSYMITLQDLFRRLALEPGITINRPAEPEQRYLETLIATIEAKRGVLEYVDLSVEADHRPEPQPEDEWGFEELLDKQQDHHQSRPVSLAMAVERHPRFVLLGDPGAGKTTTLRRLALNEARQRIEGRHGAQVPMLVQLSQWPDGQTPLDFLQTSWPLPASLPKSIQDGEVVLYLDGLNEMGATGPAKARLLKEWLDSSQGPTRVVVSCRTNDYSGDLELKPMPCVRALELSREQIGQFVSEYLGHHAHDFLSAVSHRGEGEYQRDLFLLAANPYMLSALIYIYQNSPEGNLPSNMGALFRKLTKALWRREEVRGTVDGVAADEVERALSRLALLQIQDQLPFSSSFSYALSQVGSQRILHCAANANYITMSIDRISFYHQLLQEYFAAVALTDESPSAVVARVGKPKFFGTIHARVASRWDQVLIALCGIRKDSPAVIEKISEVDRELAGKCVKGAPSLPLCARRAFIQNLLRDLEDKNGWVRFVAARTLRDVPDPIAIPALTSALNDHWGDPKYDVVSDYAKEALRAIGTTEALHAAANAPSW